MIAPALNLNNHFCNICPEPQSVSVASLNVRYFDSVHDHPPSGPKNVLYVDLNI